MKKALFITLLGMIAIALGCGAGGGAEGTAKKLLEATKKGDADTILDHMDLKGMYEANVPEGQREQVKFEEWEKQVRGAMKDTFEPNEKFEYEIISSKEEGDEATVKVKTRENDEADWEEITVPFKKIGGKWMLTAEGMAAMGGE